MARKTGKDAEGRCVLVPDGRDESSPVRSAGKRRKGAPVPKGRLNRAGRYTY
jgi:hypothetical protein